MAIADFDDIFVHIGGFGWYQIILFLTSCGINILFTFVYFGQFFMSLTPPHWCSPPPDLLDLGMTPEQIKNLTIPQDRETGEYLQCSRYIVNATQVLANNTPRGNTSWPTTSCTYGYSYDFSLYYPSITSQLDWVCDNDWKPSLAQSLFYIGSLVASPVLGWAADKWGRLPVIIVTNVTAGVAGIASAFSASFITFSVLRFIVGTTFDTHYTVFYILILEYVPSKYRTVMANVPLMLFMTLGLCIQPWIALGLHDWKAFALLIHTPLLITIVFYWFLPESARWLINQGRTEDAIRIIRKVAVVNRKTIPSGVIEELQQYGEEQTRQEQNNAGVMDLLKTPVLRRRFIILCIMWMVICLSYDGHIRNTQNIGTNLFFTFTLAGILELPADFVTMLLIETLGRRHSVVLTLIFSGLSSFAAATLSSAETISILALAMCGRFMITMSINVGQQFYVEILPTVARGTGSGAIHTLGYISMFLAPCIVYLDKFGHHIPYAIMGTVSVIGGAMCILLPETLNQKLPDSLQDGETFFVSQGYFYNPCARKNTKTEEERVTNGNLPSTETDSV